MTRWNPARRLLALACSSFLWLGAAPAAAQVDVDVGGRGQDGEVDLGFPFVYRGDGLTLTVTGFDERTLTVQGSVRLGAAAPSPFRAAVRFDEQGYQTGSGEVTTPQGARPIQLRDESETVVRVDLDGRTYRVAIDLEGDDQGAGGGAGPPGLPLTYAGQGATVVVTGFDPNTGTMTGTIALGGAPMPLTVRFEVDAQGRELGIGQVTTPNGVRPLRSYDEGETAVRIEFEGRSLRLELQTAGAATGGGEALEVTYAGDGMTLVIRGFDERTGTATGSVALAGGPAMPLSLRLSYDDRGREQGDGQVQTPNGARPLRSLDESETVTRVEFEGRTYLLSFAAPPDVADAGGDDPYGGPPAPAGAPNFPLTYAGDGLTVVIAGLDRDSAVATGTLALAGGPPLAFRLQFRLDAQGRQVSAGQVQTSAGARPLATLDESPDVTRVDFEGRSYRVSAVAVGTPPPAPAPPVSQPRGDQPPAPAGRRGGFTGGLGARAHADSGSATGAARGESRGASSGAVVLKRHATRDPGSGNMESHTFLVPDGWRVEGGAWWAGQSYFSVLPSRDIKVTAPDGRRVHLAPSIAAKDVTFPPGAGMPRPQEGAADGGYPILYRPASVAEWKQWFLSRGIPQEYPGATEIRVTGAVVVPELTQMLQRNLAPVVQAIQQNAQLDAMSGMRTSIDIAVLAIECSYTHEGRDWEELFVFGLTAMLSESQFGDSTFWSIDPSVSYRAPRGQLDASMPILTAVADSVRETPQWAKMKADHAAALNRISAKGAADRSRIIADSNREIREIIDQGYRDRSAIMDRTHERVINTIRGTEDYMVPGSSEYVQLPNTYEHVYSNGNGEYLLSNDHLYDPNLDPALNGQSWTTMQPRP